MNPKPLATVAIAGATYLLAVTWLATRGAYPLEEALGLLVVLGVAFPLLATGLLVGSRPVPYAAPTSGHTTLVVIGLLVWVTGYLTVGAGPLDALLPRAWLEPGPHAFVDLVRKLVVFVVVPWVVMRALLGWRAPAFGLGLDALRALWGRHGLATLVLAGALSAFQWFVGRGAAPLRAGELGGGALAGALMLSWVWNSIEAGLVEEFFFRAVLQSRLTVATGSQLAGSAVAALVFGLAHAPGYVLRGGAAMDVVGLHPSVLDAVAYSVAVPAVAAILFAVLWGRTRNLYACLLLHGAIDAVPNALPLVRVLGLH